MGALSIQHLLVVLVVVMLLFGSKKLPEIGGKRPLPARQLNRTSCVVDDRLDLSPMSHDACILQEAGDILL